MRDFSTLHYLRDDVANSFRPPLTPSLPQIAHPLTKDRIAYSSRLCTPNSSKPIQSKRCHNTQPNRQRLHRLNRSRHTTSRQHDTSQQCQFHTIWLSIVDTKTAEPVLLILLEQVAEWCRRVEVPELQQSYRLRRRVRSRCVCSLLSRRRL